MLGGFYHNAMGLMFRVYKNWGLHSKFALAFKDAFIPHGLVHIMEQGPSGSFPVHFPFPDNKEPLGEKPQGLNLLTIARRLLDYIWHRTEPSLMKPRGADYAHDPDFRAHLERAREAVAPDALLESLVGSKWRDEAIDALRATLAIVQAPRLMPPPRDAQEPDYGILFDIALVVALGVVADGLWWRGFDAANSVEFTAWMKKHHLSERALESAYFRCGYDYAFAYENGDPKAPVMAAGTGLRGFLRMVFTYNASVFVHMDGGMGEIVFTPLYEEMKRLGVKFRFFHRVDDLELDEAGVRLLRVRGIVQNEPTDSEYDPLVPYTPPNKPTRLVWPDAPIAARLKEKLEPAERAEFLYENPWRAPTTAKPFELVADEDFDVCLLGIPVGDLGRITQDLAQKIPDWRDMLAGSGTAPTIAAQLWQPYNTATLGWSNGESVLTANVPPHSTWADMSFLRPLEAGGTEAKAHLSYLCGPVITFDYGAPPKDIDFGPLELKRADQVTRAWCHDNLASVLPQAALPAQNVPGDPDELYVRINTFPSELYVLTMPDKVNARLTPGGSFVPNLFLAGDWTRNGYDIGSFETAVLSGLICARAMGARGVALGGEQD
ncbi:MAG TPA: hypothetical protein VF495_22235, partial [Phenylobacterium sp.]